MGDGARIFLSYRREDSSGYAGRIFDALTESFGRGAVFMDIDTLAPGQDFIQAIDDALRQCRVALVLIGPSWLAVRDAVQRRLDAPNDFVRLEIEAALSHDLRVLPVLVGGASMPPAEALPPAIAGLARRHAFELTDRRWHADVNELVGALASGPDAIPALAPPPPPPPPPPAEVAKPSRGASWRLPALFGGAAAAVVAVVVIVIALAGHRAASDGPTATPTPSSVATLTADATSASGAQSIVSFLMQHDGKIVYLNLQCYDAGYPGESAQSYCATYDKNIKAALQTESFVEVFSQQPQPDCNQTCAGMYVLTFTKVSDTVYQNLQGAGSIELKGYFSVVVRGTEGNVLPLNIQVISLSGVATQDVHP